MPEEKLPKWVPQVAPSAHADVYPVSPPANSNSSNSHQSPPAELRLDRHALVHGYSERRLPYEFSSCLPSSERTGSSTPPDVSHPSFSAADLVKLRDGLTTLRRSRPIALQRAELSTFSRPQTPVSPQHSKKSFPLQKPSSTSSLEEWFSNLGTSSPVSNTALSYPVPLGPTIGRFTGKVVEMMATRSVPTQRAVWYIRVAVLNECVKYQRPDRPAPSPRIFWTQQLSNLLRSDITSLSMRRGTPSCPMDRLTLWRYVLDLVRWQVDEGLVDISLWLRVIADVLKTEISHSQTLANTGTCIAVLAARRFLPEFLADNENARMLCEVLLPGANAVVKAWRTSNQMVKNVRSNQRKTARRTFSPNACHSEITYLLDAVIRVLDPALPPTGPELRLSDLDRFLKRGIEIIKSSKDGQLVPENKPQCYTDPQGDVIVTLAEPHQIMREFEMLPAHGDVSYVISVLRNGNKDDTRATLSAVKTICQWAVDGPVSDRAEAIAIAGALLTSLTAPQDAKSSSAPPSPKAKPTTFLKNSKKSVNQAQTSDYGSGSSTSPDPPLHRELWQFLKEFSKGREVDSLDSKNYIVRFLAHLCRLNLLSLSSFVRDVARLSICGHPGSAYLVKCLSLLPDPTDRSVADSRRSLMRKYGHAFNSRSIDSHSIEESAVKAACSSEIAVMEAQAGSLLENGNTNVILSISEAVRLEDISQISDELGVTARKVFTIASFLVYVDEPGIAVEWLLDQLEVVIGGSGDWKSEARILKRKEIITTLIRLVADLSRFIAACGQLETVYLWLKKGFMSAWVTTAIREQILHTISSLTAIFSARADSESSYWIKMVKRVLEQNEDAVKSQAMSAFVAASLRGRSTLLGDGKSMTAIIDNNNHDNWILSSDVDLQIMTNLTQCHGMDVFKLREVFSSEEREFPLDPLLVKGVTFNDLLGSVFIPVLSDLLTDPSAGTSLESPFSKFATRVLKMFERHCNSIRLQGVRPTLVIDFVALIIAGCACVHMDPSESLDVLVRMPWIWKILVPRAGINLARRLRSRVDYYCEKTSTTDKGEWIGLLSNMVLRVYGEPGRDEIVVCSALGAEPLGMVEMQLALLAVNRHECEEDDEFGSRVSDAACLDKDGAKTLTNMALGCCAFNDEYRQAMAKVIAYHAVQQMVESLNYVVTVLTMETSKSTAIHQERARQWYDADLARRTVLELCMDSLTEEVGSQVEDVLFEQLLSAAKKLTVALAGGGLPSDLLTGGQQISDALESRLMSILRSKRTVQTVDWWKQRSLETAQLLKGAVPLMKTSAIQCCLKVLEMCIKHVGDTLLNNDEKVAGSGHGNTQNADTALTCKQIVDHHTNCAFKGDLKTLLIPTMFWIEGAERETVVTLIGRCLYATSSSTDLVRVVNDDGVEVDNWVLLEGYGRGEDESCAVPPSSFWRQGEGPNATEESTRTVLLKRTYSTYSSLAL